MEKLRFKNLSDFKSMVGKELPKSDWITVTQEMINDFANATLDKQWVHVDVERAKKESPFKSTIAHGFMSLALLSKMLEDLIVIDSLKMGLNYGLNYVRFPHPVPVNSKLQIHASIKDIEDQGQGVKVTFSCIVVIDGFEKPACIAEFLGMMFE
ncbi:MaoC family dehydratase [Pseudotenacibaculum sp. MALMAid0570]|uniref:MaoC family dehydratase n=1 Tax=Pseudotenacibaculum sp. MALMAid0570 TaxID=3143938 RepID=UPI0032DFBBAB